MTESPTGFVEGQKAKIRVMAKYDLQNSSFKSRITLLLDIETPVLQGRRTGWGIRKVRFSRKETGWGASTLASHVQLVPSCSLGCLGGNAPRISGARDQNGFSLGYPVLIPELQHRVGAAEPGAIRFGDHCQSLSRDGDGAWCRELRPRPGGRYSTRQHLRPADTRAPETPASHRHLRPADTAPRRHLRPADTAPRRHLHPTDTRAPETPAPHRHLCPADTAPRRHLHPTDTCAPRHLRPANSYAASGRKHPRALTPPSRGLSVPFLRSRVPTTRHRHHATVSALPGTP